jgi:hypothetical protein
VHPQDSTARPRREALFPKSKDSQLLLPAAGASSARIGDRWFREDMDESFLHPKLGMTMHLFECCNPIDGLYMILPCQAICNNHNIFHHGQAGPRDALVKQRVCPLCSGTSLAHNARSWRHFMPCAELARGRRVLQPLSRSPLHVAVASITIALPQLRFVYPVSVVVLSSPQLTAKSTSCPVYTMNKADIPKCSRQNYFKPMF